MQFYQREWRAENEVARVVFVHGFDEWIDRYDKLFSNMQANAISVFAWDQRGFGRTSEAKREWAVTGGYEQVLQDVDQHVFAQSKTCNSPLFLWGHSMGGAIVINYGCFGKHRELLAGIISSSPLIELHTATKPKIPYIFSMARMASYLVPHQQIQVTVDPKYLNNNDQLIQEYASSPFQRGVMTLQSGSDMFLRGQDLLHADVYSKLVDCSLLMTHADNDYVNSCEASRTFFERVSVKDKTLQIYPGGMHEVHNHLQIGPQMMKDIIAWLLKHSTVSRL